MGRSVEKHNDKKQMKIDDKHTYYRESEGENLDDCY